MGISLILAVDGIVPPLTGIGRYALELALGLATHPEIEDLRCFAHGLWVGPPARAKFQEGTQPRPGALLRAALAGNRAAVRVYQRLVPQISRWRLRGERDALFHSPSYMLPPFPGASIATVHDLSHVLYPQFHPAARVDYMNRAFPRTLRCATHLITDAESVRRELIARMGWAADRVTAVPLGVGAEFRPHAAAELRPLMQKLRLEAGGYSLCVGTIEPRKNIDRLLSAYEALPRGLRRMFPLVLAGAAGWRSAQTHSRIVRAQAENWLRYLSFVPQDELPALYAGARLFVYPSLYEGFGLPVLEAMASGTPVITSNVSSLPEVVGGAARLVEPQDVDSLRCALEDVLQDDEWRTAAGAAGLARAATFSWSECVDRTVSVYKKLMR